MTTISRQEDVYKAQQPPASVNTTSLTCHCHLLLQKLASLGENKMSLLSLAFPDKSYE